MLFLVKDRSTSPSTVHFIHFGYFDETNNMSDRSESTCTQAGELRRLLEDLDVLVREGTNFGKGLGIKETNAPPSDFIFDK